MSEQVSKVLRIGGDHATFWCPGCDEAHRIRIGGGGAWGYNGNADAPTFTPSVLVRGGRDITDEEHARVMATGESVELPDVVCHSFVTDGRIQFLNDCTHALAGQTVPLGEWPNLPASPAAERSDR